MKTTSITLAGLAIATIAGLLSASPAAAAARTLTLQDDTFQQRCLDKGGVLDLAANGLVCTVGTTAVACEFRVNTASCQWPGGIYNRAALALLGWPDSAVSYETTGGIAAPGNGGGGGGIDVPDLPFDNGGGGGFDKPDFDLKDN